MIARSAHATDNAVNNLYIQLLKTSSFGPLLRFLNAYEWKQEIMF